MSELFPADAVAMDSPRLAWMKRNGIVTYCSMPATSDRRWFAGFREWWPQPEYADAASFFCAETGRNGDSRIGEGSTEDEAITHLAKRSSIRLWSEEGGAAS